jgi:hypothetical protein
MNKWPFVVAGLYGLVFALLFVPLFLVSLMGSDAVELAPYVGFWLWILVMNLILAQFALLQIPISTASRRPLSQRSLLSTVAAASFMMALLMFGAACCLYEFVTRLEDDGNWLVIPAVVGTSSWVLWGLYFHVVTKRAKPGNRMTRIQKFMWTGSILEFLIAVPTHVIARNRDYCCAGFMTFIGLTCGLSVMLFAFGPSVYVLFVDRWKRLHPPPA